jgi:adenylate cyclase
MITQRFIEIAQWTTARKTVIWTAYLLATHVLFLVAAFFSLRAERIFHMAGWQYFGFYGLWAGALILVLLASLSPARGGGEGRWTGYLLTVVYGSFAVAQVHLMGSITSPHIALLVLQVLLVAVFWDLRLGAFTFVYVFALLGLVLLMEASGRLPYAPLVVDRALDTQVNPGVLMFYYVMYGSGLLFCLGTIGLVITARQLQERRLSRAQALIRQYLPSQVADAIVSGREEIAERHERRKLTIFFSDLVGFTAVSEELEPEELARVLDDYFTEMTAIAARHGGTVDELSGDAILIFFGAPHATDDKDHALRAVRMAQEMQRAMASLNARWQTAGITEALQVRMGIHTGVVTVGNFGSRDRKKYAALGKHVNLAARIQALCRPGEILISHASCLLVRDEISCIGLGEREFKGITKPVALYRVDGSLDPAGRPDTAGT